MPLGVQMWDRQIKPWRFHFYMLLSELIERYKNWGGLGYKRGSNSTGTINGYQKDLLLFCLYMRNPHIEKIVEPQITAYFREMLSLGWSQNGLMCKSIALRNAFEYAKRIGCDVIDHDLIQIIPRDIKIPRVAEDWEIERLLEQCPVNSRRLMDIRNRALILFLRSTGCRNSEMLSINIEQIMEHFSENRVLIRTAKSRGVKPVRELYWDKECHQALLKWLEVREVMKDSIVFKDPDALFVGVRNWQTGKRLTNSAVDIAFRAMSRRAGIPTVNPHSFRHHRGHEMNKAGANNSTISSVLGHSNMASSYIYTQMSSEELKDSANKYRNNPVKPT